MRAQIADRTWDGVGIEANMMGGKVFKHSTKFFGPVPRMSGAFELAVFQQTDGRKPWQQRRKYPVWGVGITYTDYGLDSIYGKCIGIYPTFQLPLVRCKKLEWTLRFGLGLGYVTKRYSFAPDYDTLNNAISSHINNFTLFTSDLRYHIDKHWDVQVGGNFSHISNAAFRQPNLGVNMYGAHIGLRYFPVTAAPERTLRLLPPLRNRWLVHARLGLAMNGGGNGGGPMYPVYLASLYTSKRYAGKNKAFAGVDYSYHSNVYAFLKNNELVPGEERAHSWKSAVFIGHEWLMGRGAFVLQAGVYLHEAALRLDPYYQKLGYNYYLIRREEGPIKELFLSALLKTHLTQAELAEFGVGFSL